MRVAIFSLIMFCSLAVSFTLALAQQAGHPPAHIPQHLEELGATSASKEPPMQPSAQLQSLIQALSGKWSVSVKFEPNPAMPKGLEGKGEEVWSPGPGGFTVLEQEHIPAPGGDVFLLGIIWWNGKTKSLQGMECNNQLPYTCDLKGALNDITMSWDGKQFRIDEWETHGGKKTLWHEVWSDLTATSFTQTGDVEEPGGATNRFFTMQAKRVGDQGK